MPLMEKHEVGRESDEFLGEVKNLPHKNLAVELLTKLPNDEIKTRLEKNVVQARSFGDMLKTAVAKYQNRMIEAAAIIQELIELARELRESDRRGARLGMNDDEIAFYDALADNCNTRALMGNEQLCVSAQILVRRVKNSVSESLTWTPPYCQVYRERFRNDCTLTFGLCWGKPPLATMEYARRALSECRHGLPGACSGLTGGGSTCIAIGILLQRG